jgi:hypothetical protein
MQRTMSDLPFGLRLLHERLARSDNTSILAPDACIDPQLLEKEMLHTQDPGTPAGQDILSTSCLAG